MGPLPAPRSPLPVKKEACSMRHSSKSQSNCRVVRASAVINLFLSGEILFQLDRVAKDEGRTRCELIREAIRRYTASRQRQTIPRWGGVRSHEARGAAAQVVEDALAEVGRLGSK
jgi:predicted transcriptional regulator